MRWFSSHPLLAPCTGIANDKHTTARLHTRREDIPLQLGCPQLRFSVCNSVQVVVAGLCFVMMRGVIETGAHTDSEEAEGEESRPVDGP
eukprot:503918-Rhodomonas_salina.1